MTTKIQARTKDIIESYRGLPGEFYMLKGLLCLDMAVGNGAEKREGFWAGDAARKMVVELFDGDMIAERMDELRRERRNCQDSRSLGRRQDAIG